MLRHQVMLSQLGRSCVLFAAREAREISMRNRLLVLVLVGFLALLPVGQLAGPA